jgi:aspartyl-tRNA synthetase
MFHDWNIFKPVFDIVFHAKSQFQRRATHHLRNSWGWVHVTSASGKIPERIANFQDTDESFVVGIDGTQRSRPEGCNNSGMPIPKHVSIL